METVQADTRAIYGKTGRSTGRVNMRGEKMAEINALNRPCFFRPDGHGSAVQIRQGWDLAQIFMLFYVALVVPFRIGFSKEAHPTEALFWFEAVVDLYFVVDIFLNFRTAYYDSNSELVIDQKMICLSYFRGWFLLDFLSCLPVTYISLAMSNANEGAGRELKMLKMFRMLRLAKLLRLARIKRLLKRLEEQYRFLAKGSRIVVIVASILFTAHLVACTWHLAGSSKVQMIGTDRLSGELVREKPWVMEMYGGIGNGATDDPDFESGLQVSTLTRYLDALYYSVTTLTTVGYGDRVPSTNVEKVISILCELAGSVTFGIIAGSLSTIAMSESMTRVEVKQKINQLEELMQEKNVPAGMRQQLSSQMANWFEKKSVFDEEVLLSYLPPRQRKDLLIAIYKPFMTQCPLLQGLEWPVISRMCLMMRPYLAVVNDTIFSEGDVGEEMYLIVRGSIQLRSSLYPAYNARMWEDGAFFGELPMLLCGGDGTESNVNTHVYTARALVNTDCTYITQEDFDELNVQRPTLKITMRMHALQRATRFGTNSAASKLMSTMSSPVNSSIDTENANTPTSPSTGSAWYCAAKQIAPHLLSEEIKGLRAVFLQYAGNPTKGADEDDLVIDIDAIQHILDDSLRQMFDRLDTDKSGALGGPEIKVLLTLLDMPSAAGDLQLVMLELDKDGSGEVEYQEFREWFHKSQFVTESNRQREMQDLFNAVDTDRSGFIDWDEFLRMVSSHLLRDLELQHAEQEGGTIMKHVSGDSDEEQQEKQKRGTRRAARDPAEMVRVALNTVRDDTRSIYGTAMRPQPMRLEFEDEMMAKTRKCFFRPDGNGAAVKFRQMWDLVQVFILFYVALVVPFRIGFSSDATVYSAVFWWELLVDCYFWIDIMLNFRTGYYNRYGKLVIDQRKVCKRYAKGWFLLDVVSVLPVMYIELLIYGTETREGSQFMMLKSFRLLRMAKLLRLARIKRLLVRLEKQYKEVAQGGRVAKIMFFILLSAHFVACGWHFVGDGAVQRLGTNAAGEEVILKPWVKELYDHIEEGACNVSGVLLPSDECDKYGKYTVSLVTKYLDALYYSVTTLTTVGYGDRVPNTNNEKILSIFCELAGSVTFGVIAGSLSAIAMSESMSRQVIKNRSAKLDEFMRSKNVPKQMREEISSQLLNYFEKKSALDERQIISCLPPKHQKDLVMSIYVPYLVDCPLVHGLERGLLSRLCLIMRPYLALAGDEIVVENEIGEEMYLITRGTVRLQSTRYPAYNTRQWEDGAFFGELPLLDCGAEEIDTAAATHNIKKEPRRVLHIYSATAIVDSHCTYVTRQDLDELNQKRPELKQTMRKFAMQRAVRFGVDVAFQTQNILDQALAGTRSSGPTGIIQLVETARQQMSEAMEDSRLQHVDERTKAPIEKLLAVDVQLKRICEVAERMLAKKARDRSGVPGA